MESTAEQLSQDAIHSAKNAQQAIELARAAQLQEAVESGIENFFETRKSDRFIDINRIPFICDDMKGMHSAMNDLATDLRWMKWIGSGFVAAAGLLALKSLGL